MTTKIYLAYENVFGLDQKPEKIVNFFLTNILM